jgi:hypothetical protein
MVREQDSIAMGSRRSQADRYDAAVTLTRLWALLAVGLPTLAAVIAPLQTVDLTYHLRAGAEILDTRAIPAADTWTFTATGLPWTDQQWGAQLLLAMVYRAGGWTGLVILRAVLVALTFGCVFLVSRRAGLGVRLAAGITLAAFAVSAAGLALRPQLFGVALLAVVLLLVADRRAHPGRMWAVPVVVLAWANLHGSFFLGSVVLGLAWLEDLHDRIERRHLALVVAVVAAVAACVTPFGPLVWSYAIGLSTNPDVTQRITEWQRTSPFEIPGLLFYASAAAVLLLVARRWRTSSWPAFVWLGLFFVIGAYAARGIAWWSIGAVVPVAGMLASARPATVGGVERTTPPILRRLNAVIAGAIVLAGVAALPAWRPVDAGLNAPAGVLASAPPGITGELRDLARPGDRLLNAQVWGSWFEFALPNVPVAIDSRIELFPTATWDAYDVILGGGPQWEAQLAAWDVTIAAVTATDASFVERLEGAGWRVVYSDTGGWILTSPDRSG